MIDVVFVDAGRKATEKPNPRFPDGMRVDLNINPLHKSCTRNLPYPAPRVGSYIVSCRECRFSAGITVAGRADDPRVVTIPCKAVPGGSSS